MPAAACAAIFPRLTSLFLLSAPIRYPPAWVAGLCLFSYPHKRGREILFPPQPCSCQAASPALQSLEPGRAGLSPRITPRHHARRSKLGTSHPLHLPSPCPSTFWFPDGVATDETDRRRCLARSTIRHRAWQCTQSACEHHVCPSRWVRDDHSAAPAVLDSLHYLCTATGCSLYRVIKVQRQLLCLHRYRSPGVTASEAGTMGQRHVPV